MTSITQERIGLGRLGQPLRLRSQWGAIRSYTDTRAVTEPATDQWAHIAVINPGNYANNDVVARVIEKIGIARFPATGISYNRGVMMDGARYEFQPIGRRGAHTGSYSGNCTSSGCPFRGDNVTSANHNVTGRGYVLCQNVDDTVSAIELDALARMMAADRLAGFVRMDAKIHGHRCVSSKSCPGDKMWALMGKLRLLINHYLVAGFQPPIPPPEEDDLPITTADLVTIWETKRWTEYFDEDQDAVRDPRSAIDILFSSHRAAHEAKALAKANADALKRIEAKLAAAPPTP